jgi:hypothetical protein
MGRANGLTLVARSLAQTEQGEGERKKLFASFCSLDTHGFAERKMLQC